MDVDVFSCFIINIYKFRDVSGIFVIYYDEKILVVDVEGLILELIELLYDVDKRLGDVGLEEDLGQDGLDVIKFKLWKWFKLEVFEIDSDVFD